PVTRYEDLHPVVMISAPVIDLLDGTPTRQDCAGILRLVQEVSGCLRGAITNGRNSLLRLVSVCESVPFVEPHEVVTAGVARLVVRTGDVPIKGRGHVEH